MFVNAVQTWRKYVLWMRSTHFDFPGQHKHKHSLTHPEERQSLSSSLSSCFSQLFENCQKHNLEMEEAMMEPDDQRKKCFGCTSLRSGTIIIGAFDIVLSTIAIVVSVVAMMNAQVRFLLF